jgi:phage terminase large subunit
MFAKWDKYWTGGNTLLAIVCVLDPRCKLVVVEYYIDKMYVDDECSRFIANLKACMNELFKEYLEAHSMLVQNQVSNSTQQPLRYCSEHEFKLYSTSIDLK